MPGQDVEFAWSQVRSDLELRIDDLDVGQSVTVSVSDRQHFVRSTRLTPTLLRLEAVSNGHLPPVDRLDFEALDLLADLGWRAPNRFVDQIVDASQGTSYHFLDLTSRWDGASVASVLVRTLRAVFEVPGPESLICATAPAESTSGHQCRASDDPGEAGVPVLDDAALDAVHDAVLDDLRRDDAVLEDLLTALATIGRIDRIEAVEQTDGVVCITLADELITVYHDPAHRLVRIALPVVSNFPATSQALMAMNDCGRPLRCGRLEWRNGTVYVLIDLPAHGPVGDLLGQHLSAIDVHLDNIRDTLDSFRTAVDS